jgi:hypothetical protein
VTPLQRVLVFRFPDLGPFLEFTEGHGERQFFALSATLNSALVPGAEAATMFLRMVESSTFFPVELGDNITPFQSPFVWRAVLHHVRHKRAFVNLQAERLLKLRCQGLDADDQPSRG